MLAAKQLGFSGASNANGAWRQGPDGSIRQAGEVTLVNGAASITFPRPFQNGCDGVWLTAVLGSAALSDCSVYLTAEPGLSSAAIGGTTTTLGVGGAITGGSFKVRWVAFGS